MVPFDLTLSDAELITMYYGIGYEELDLLGTMLDDALHAMLNQEDNQAPNSFSGIAGLKGFTGAIGANGFKSAIFSCAYADAKLYSSTLLNFIKFAKMDHWELGRVYEIPLNQLPLLINEVDWIEKAFVKWRLQIGK